MDVFKILVFAIVAGLLLYLIPIFFSQGNEKLLGDLRNALSYAESKEGKLHEAEMAMPRGFAAKGETLDTESRNVRFECASADTCLQSNIKAKPRMLLVDAQALTRVFFRCRRVLNINDCVIYFGEKPAQIDISKTTIDAPMQKGTGKVSFEVKNVGSFNAVQTQWGVKIYEMKKDGSEYKPFLKSELSDKIETIKPSASEKIEKEFEIPYAGKYLVKVIVEGEDSGMDSWEKEIEVEGAIPEKCAALSERRATLYNGICRKEYSCNGCEFGYECKQRWTEKGVLESIVTETYSSAIYTEQAAVGGKCG